MSVESDEWDLGDRGLRPKLMVVALHGAWSGLLVQLVGRSTGFGAAIRQFVVEGMHVHLESLSMDLGHGRELYLVMGLHSQQVVH